MNKSNQLKILIKGGGVREVFHKLGKIMNLEFFKLAAKKDKIELEYISNSAAHCKNLDACHQ